MLQNNYIVFGYECTLLGLTRKHRVNTDKLNESVKGVAVHNATTDLSADDPVYKAIRLKRQDFINNLKRRTLDWHGSLKLVSLDVTYFENFKKYVDKFESDFNDLVEQFLPDEKTYRQMIQRAKDNDPNGFDASMYPTFKQARAKFSFTYNLNALSDMQDERLDAIDEHVDFIKEKAKQDHIRNLEKVEEQTQDRILKSVRHIIEAFSSKSIKDKHGNEVVKPNRFQESSMLNHLELVNILNAFNIGNNTKISSLITDFEKAMSPIQRDKVNDFETLRDNDDTRLKVKSDMEAILKKFNI